MESINFDVSIYDLILTST